MELGWVGILMMKGVIENPSCRTVRAFPSGYFLVRSRGIRLAGLRTEVR